MLQHKTIFNISFAISITYFVFLVLGYRYFPENIATKYDFSGNVIHTSQKSMLFLMFFVQTMVLFLLYRKANNSKSSPILFFLSGHENSMVLPKFKIVFSVLSLLACTFFVVMGLNGAEVIFLRGTALNLFFGFILGSVSLAFLYLAKVIYFPVLNTQKS